MMLLNKEKTELSLMAEKKKKSSVFSVSSVAVVWLWMFSVVAIEGRVVPLLQSYEKSGFRPSLNAIYDTSKYGILQLNNGLAQTPPMGFVSLCFSHFFTMPFFIFFAIANWDSVKLYIFVFILFSSHSFFFY